MRILLDTCTFLWLATEIGQVSAKAKEAFADPENEAFLSVVSCWEIAVKHAAGKLKLPQPPFRLISTYRDRYGVGSLSLDEESALHVGRLPKLHGDPFDRMLIAQAQVAHMRLLTADRAAAAYGEAVLLVS